MIEREALTSGWYWVEWWSMNRELDGPFFRIARVNIIGPDHAPLDGRTWVVVYGSAENSPHGDYTSHCPLRDPRIIRFVSKIEEPTA